MKESTLLQEADIYFQQGIDVLLKDPATNRNIGTYSEYKPIDDRETLESLCDDHPEANFAIVIDQEKSNLVAFAVGVGDWASNGHDEFKTLVKSHGKPETLTFKQSDGSLYYLFRTKSGYTHPKLKGSEGMDFMKLAEPMLVPPSVVNGGPVERVGTATNIIDIEDWLSSHAEEKATPSHQVTSSIESEAIGENNEHEVGILGKNHNEAEINDATEKESKSAPLPLSEAKIGRQSADTTKDNVPALTSDQAVLDSFIIEKLEGGMTKEQTFKLALRYCVKLEIIEPDKRTLGRVIDASANIIYKNETLEYPLPFILEMADYLMHAFIDEHDQPHVFQKDNGQVTAMADKAIIRLIGYHYLLIKGGLTKAKYLKDALSILEMKTRYESEKITLCNRVGRIDENIFFDMGDANSIKTTNKDWKINPSPILFRRFGHQAVQVKPTPGGDPWKLFDYLNIDENDKLLLMVYIISLFVPDIAHPVLNVWGEHGSAKSFLCTAINQLCDPTSVTKLMPNKNDLDLIQNLYKHYVTVYDNLSEITPHLSDILCQACTGSSFNKRRLYTDSEDVVFRIKHAVILNSIEMLLMRQDLIDRSIILHLKRISPSRRRQEADLWTGFDADKASILGGIFDCLVKAMEILPKVPPMELPRMADFYQWGYAITEALGREGAEFVAAYASNINKQNNCVRHNNTLCQAVIELMEGRELHDATVKVTLEKLVDIANPRASDQTFPKAPKELAAHLGQIKPTLAEYGIEFTVGARQGRGTPLIITKSPEPASPASPASPDAPQPTEPSEASEPDEATQQHKCKVINLMLDDSDFGGEI